MTQYIYATSGKSVGFIRGRYIHALNGTAVGQLSAAAMSIASAGNTSGNCSKTK